MTKIKPNLEDVMSAEELLHGLFHVSPYSTVAVRYLQLKGVKQDFNGYYNIADLLEAYHELAKIDHRVNKGQNQDKDEGDLL